MAPEDDQSKMSKAELMLGMIIIAVTCITLGVGTAFIFGTGNKVEKELEVVAEDSLEEEGVPAPIADKVVEVASNELDKLAKKKS